MNGDDSLSGYSIPGSTYMFKLSTILLDMDMNTLDARGLLLSCIATTPKIDPSSRAALLNSFASPYVLNALLAFPRMSLLFRGLA